MRDLMTRVASVVLAGLAGAVPVWGQDFEAVGTRARGMGGAFVAVADDATAVWWNPAGLATIPAADAAVFWSGTELLTDDEQPVGGNEGPWRLGGPGFALGLPVLGLSYVQTSRAEVVAPATGATPPDRQDGRTAVLARRFRAQHIGLSLTQSIGDAVVVGSTVRALRGRFGVGTLSGGTPAGAALDLASELGPNDAGWTADVDVGALAILGRLRLGLTARNLAAPTFEFEDARIRTPRLVRVGLAYGGAPGWGRRDWTVALDAELTTSEWADGQRRNLAVGAERWLAGRRVGIRGGARAQTVGQARAVATAGASLAVRPSVLLEGDVMAGGDTAERGWGVGVRVTY